MKLFMLSYFLLLSTFLSAQSVELSYEQHIFDSDITCCWRKLSNEGKHAEAAALIVDYLNNSPNAVNKHSLKWHAGQAYAAAGNNRLAIRYYKKTYNIFYKWFGDEDLLAWYYYAKGNVAYIKKDRDKLERIIAKWEKKKLEKDNNYKELLRLLGDL